MLNITVENVVLTARFSTALDLAAIAKAFPKAERLEKFPALSLKFKRPRVTLLIFESGKIVCSGARSEDEASSVVEGFVDALRRNGIPLPNPQINVENVVVSAQLEAGVEAVKGLDGTVYEPEGFPGVVVRLKEVEPSFLVFSSGKVVCIGARTLDAAIQALATLEASLAKAR